MNAKKTRMAKKDWLEKALQILAFEGITKLTIDHLVKEIGVTTGSYYWHFKNRSDFLNQLVDYWASEYTDIIINEVAKTKDPKERLLKMMLLLTEQDYVRYDMAVMDWGSHEPFARKKIQQAIDTRLHFLRTAFAEMGFEGDDLEMRAYTVLTFQTMEDHGYNQLSKEERLRHVKLRHDMLTQK
jgi:AcrR family transcriptional regulator